MCKSLCSWCSSVGVVTKFFDMATNTNNMDIISQLSAAIEFDFGLDLLNWASLSSQKFKDPSIILKHQHRWDFNVLSENKSLSEFIKNNPKLPWNHYYICLAQPLNVIEALNIDINKSIIGMCQNRFLTQEFVLAHPEVNWRMSIFEHIKFDIEFMKTIVPLDTKKFSSFCNNPRITIDLLEQIVEIYPNMNFQLDEFRIVTPKLVFKNGPKNNSYSDDAVINILNSPNFNTNETYQYLQSAVIGWQTSYRFPNVSRSPKFDLQFALDHQEFPHWDMSMLTKRYEKETGKKVKLTTDNDTVVVIDQHKKLLRVQTQDGKPATHRLRVQIDPQQLQGETTIDIDMDDVVVV